MSRIGSLIECIAPNWENTSRVHDWRNHVSQEIRDIWGTFTPEQRVALAEDYQAKADTEDWE